MAKTRKVNAAAFAKQMEEAVIGDDSLREILVDKAGQRSVWVKLPVNLNAEDTYQNDLASCTTDEEMCLEALSHKAGVTAEEQWEIWCEAWAVDGGKPKAAKLLMNILFAEAQDAEDRAKNFRYRG